MRRPAGPGATRLRKALVKSRNLVSIRLLREVGVDFALDYVERFGFDRERLPHSLTLALGSGEITPLQSAAAYSVLANGGFAVHPWFVDRIVNRHRETVLASTPTRVCRECEEGVSERDGAAVARRMVPAGDAWILQSILRDVVRRGTGRKALALGRHEVGGRAALPMWVKFMRAELASVPERIPPPPEGLVKVRINPDTGRLAAASDPDALFETFRAATLPDLPAGRSTGTNAGASSSDSSRATGTTQQLF